MQSCKGVHVGRWVGGMCPICFCELAASMMEAERIVETIVGRTRFIVQSFEDRVVG